MLLQHLIYATFLYLCTLKVTTRQPKVGTCDKSIIIALVMNQFRDIQTFKK